MHPYEAPDDSNSPLSDSFVDSLTSDDIADTRKLLLLGSQESLFSTTNFPRCDLSSNSTGAGSPRDEYGDDMMPQPFHQRVSNPLIRRAWIPSIITFIFYSTIPTQLSTSKFPILSHSMYITVFHISTVSIYWSQLVSKHSQPNYATGRFECHDEKLWAATYWRTHISHSQYYVIYDSWTAPKWYWLRFGQSTSRSS